MRYDMGEASEMEKRRRKSRTQKTRWKRRGMVCGGKVGKGDKGR